MSAGAGRWSSADQLSTFVVKVAIIALVLCATPAQSARRAFLGDLEPKGSVDGASGRRLLAKDNEFDVIDTIGLDVLEIVREQYDPSIGCYGGYGVYGYYGYWYGAYGTYNDEIFVDYLFEPEGYTSLEVEEDDFGSRRMMISEDDFSSGDDYTFGLKPYEFDVEDSFLDYETVVTPTYTFTYQGEGDGRYYGYVPLYFGKYNGDLYFDYESNNERLALLDWIAKTLGKETRDEAREELEANLAAGKWATKYPTPTAAGTP